MTVLYCACVTQFAESHVCMTVTLSAEHLHSAPAEAYTAVQRPNTLLLTSAGDKHGAGQCEGVTCLFLQLP